MSPFLEQRDPHQRKTAYYYRLFTGVQQSYASTNLNTLWQQDPFKAKWAVLAKTYSLIKNRVGKRKAPLNTFLQLTCRKMGIIAVADYLKILGWDMTHEGGLLVVSRVALPDLAAFHPSILNCSLNHIDLLQFVLNKGYLSARSGFDKEVRDANRYILASTPTMTPEKAQAAFARAIYADPKHVAAKILGININHMFLDISSNTFPDANTRPYQLPIVANTQPAPPSQQPLQVVGPYPWTGSITSLYQTNEMQLDSEALVGKDEWIITDISNPVDMGSFLETPGGYNPDVFFPGRKSMQVLQMSLTDHSQNLARPPTCTTSTTHSN